jgi:prepilin-type N-terminal cleavage/methylation domain-containing protein/prepilin-type processing-associated H-X9-DG protein
MRDFIMQKHKGFTLVELLVVISIIAILLAVLVPSLKKARELAKSTVCRTRLHSLGLALLLYANDNCDIFLPQDWSYFDPAVGKNLITDYWFYRIAPYISGKEKKGVMSEFCRCPSGLAFKEFGDEPPNTDWKSIDYGLHAYGNKWDDNGVLGSYGKVSKIKHPEQFASFFDFYYGSKKYGDVTTILGKFVGGTIYAAKYQRVSYHYERITKIKSSDYLYRHSRSGQTGINVVYVDGHTGFVRHVRSMSGVKADDLYKYEWNDYMGGNITPKSN